MDESWEWESACQVSKLKSADCELTLELQWNTKHLYCSLILISSFRSSSSTKLMLGFANLYGGVKKY